jgi:hypothetical protein
MFAAALLFGAAASAPVVLAPTHYDLPIRIEPQNPSAQPLREASFLFYRLMKSDESRELHAERRHVR